MRQIHAASARAIATVQHASSSILLPVAPCVLQMCRKPCRFKQPALAQPAHVDPRRNRCVRWALSHWE
eukprot:4562817-Alexandrium_andersonii.AAC.1